VAPGSARTSYGEGLAELTQASRRARTGGPALSRNTTDGQDHVIALVDETGATIGSASKAAAHRAPGQLHRAFSVFLLDPRGRLLIQRRALTKYHFAGLWSNSCCGHPRPGQDVLEAASTRVAEELGLAIAPSDLTSVDDVVYRVADPVSGLVEFEFDRIIVGRVRRVAEPNAAEVAEVALAPIDEVEAAASSGAFTAWFPIVLRAALPALRDGRTLPPDRGRTG
jgi:isopentenyl-diphosphate Delta-isomerase